MVVLDGSLVVAFRVLSHNHHKQAKCQTGATFSPRTVVATRAALRDARGVVPRAARSLGREGWNSVPSA